MMIAYYLYGGLCILKSKREDMHFKKRKTCTGVISDSCFSLSAPFEAMYIIYG